MSFKCPKANCTGGGPLGSGTGRYGIECHICHHKWYVRRWWNWFKETDESRRARVEVYDKSSLSWKNRNTKKCPGTQHTAMSSRRNATQPSHVIRHCIGCFADTQKAEGCNVSNTIVTQLRVSSVGV
jgi:hypothetical protein